MADVLLRRIQQFILENYLFTTDTSALGFDDALLALGIVDSSGILDIIMFIEEQFGVTMQDHEIIPDNLDSVNKIASFVHARTQGMPLSCP